MTDTSVTNEELVLVPPTPVKAIEPTRADQMVKLSVEVIAELDQQIDEFVGHIVQLEPQSPEFLNRVKAVQSAGDLEIAQSASMSNRMLERPVKTMELGGLSDRNSVSTTLIELRRAVEDLDPSKQGDLFQVRKILGIIPMGSRLLDYFDRYTSAQSNLNRIITALNNGRDELERDNAAIEEEKLNLWNLMQRIEQYAYVVKGMDAKLEKKAAELDGVDPLRAKAVREDVLFYIRQKHTDLLTQMAVNIQGYLALDMIRKTNLELIKGVQRASTTTIAALRTAVLVAQALTSQKLVLDQVTALNRTTGNLIESTSLMLKRQTGEIYKQSAEGTVELDKLKRAFQNIYDTMDAMADFKSRALGNMAQTVDALSHEVNKAQTYLDNVRSARAGAALNQLTFGPATNSPMNDGVVSL